MIHIDFSDLTDKRSVQKLAEEAQLEVVQKVTLDVHRNVVLGSPVDTGAFRGAWTVETPIKPGDSGKIENATPYGPQLLRGHSKQAPDGWVDNAVEAAVRLGGE